MAANEASHPPTAIPIPRKRSHPCAPPEEYATLRAEQPVARLALADGSEGWLLSRYDDVCTLLTDPRFSAKDRVVSAAVRALPAKFAARLGNQQSLLNLDPPEHTRLRRLVAGQFSVRRMRQLAPRIRQIVTGHLDRLAVAGPPADLVPTFAQPVPLLVMCELLGVPEEDRAEFQDRSMMPQRLGADLVAVMRAADDMYDYMRELAVWRRAEPGDDVLSELADPANKLTDHELASLGVTLLIAGVDTTANMIGLGCYQLLAEPAGWADLVAAAEETPGDAESGLTESAVEELLRYLSIVQFGLNRWAVADIEIGGQLIRAGEMVFGVLSAANWDPDRFSEPDRFDLHRGRTAHLAFGYGIHQCVGQQLARLELQVVFTELPRRFPSLRLAVAADQVPMRQDMVIYGVHGLPVTW